MKSGKLNFLKPVALSGPVMGLLDLDLSVKYNHHTAIAVRAIPCESFPIHKSVIILHLVLYNWRNTELLNSLDLMPQICDHIDSLYTFIVLYLSLCHVSYVWSRPCTTYRNMKFGSSRRRVDSLDMFYNGNLYIPKIN